MTEIVLPAPTSNTHGVCMEMEVDWEPLRMFFWTKFFVSCPSEGFFAVLTNDLRKEVWSHIDDHKTFARAAQVNSKWRIEMEVAWREFCHKQSILQELKFWEEHNRDWKWVIKSKLISFKEADAKNGPGTFQETNGLYEGEWTVSTKERL
jgi:hypothetical protein